MTPIRHPDSVRLEEEIRARLRSTVGHGQFRLLPRGIDGEKTAAGLEALWDRLVMEGPGVEMIKRMIDAYDEVMADWRRRDDLWRRMSSIIERADSARLESLGQLVSMFETVDAALVVDAEIEETEEETPVDPGAVPPGARKRVDCVGCGAEIRYERDQINTDEPEPGRGWVHVSDNRVVCDTGEGLARPWWFEHDNEPL